MDHESYTDAVSPLFVDRSGIMETAEALVPSAAKHVPAVSKEWGDAVMEGKALIALAIVGDWEYF